MKKKAKINRYAPLDPPNHNLSQDYLPKTVHKIGEVLMEAHSGYVWIGQGRHCIEIPVKDFKLLIVWSQKKQRAYRWNEAYGRLEKG